jgi:hypothetical protein
MASNPVTDLTVVLTTGSNAGYLNNRQEQLWEGPPTRIRRRAFTVQNSPDWNGLTPATGDVVRTNVIDQGAFVLAVFAYVITAGTASSTISIGDTGSATQYIANLATSSTGITISAATTWKWYATASDYLLVTMGTTAAATGAVIDVGFLATSLIPYTNPVTE